MTDPALNAPSYLRARGELDEARELLSEQEPICTELGDLGRAFETRTNQALIRPPTA